MDAAKTLEATRLTEQTPNCTISVTEAKEGVADIICTIKGGPAGVANKKITWSRTAAGKWSCLALDIEEKLASIACPVKKA